MVLFSLFLIMGLYIKDKNREEKGKVGESKLLLMVLHMKGIGSMIFQMEEVFLFNLMEVDMMDNFRMKDVMGMESLQPEIRHLHMKANFKMMFKMDLELKLNLTSIHTQVTLKTLKRMELV